MSDAHPSSGYRHEKRCMGEFPLFPGWLFFEQESQQGIVRICAYGPGGRAIVTESPNREFALAECLRKILKPHS